MKKYIYKITALTLIVVAFASCSDFLDIEPKDKILEDKAYGSEQSINILFNGIYQSLAEPSLYGRQLSMDAVEILGQQYSMPSPHIKSNMAKYAYDQSDVKNVFEGIWSKGYNTILSTNRFLENIDKHPGVISQPKTDLLKGEAYAIRAMVHFDLLRLFGPIYKTESSNLAIPYYKEAKAQAAPFLPATEVVTNVLSDIDKALALLAIDPVITMGTSRTSDGISFYISNRNFRLNYYAVKALKARVLLYSGDAAGAYATATEVINQTTTVFPWTSGTDMTGTKPDRTFSKEIMLGIFNTNLYKNQAALFSSDLTANTIYCPNATRLSAVYESNDNDYRSNSAWKVPTTGEFIIKTFYKYTDNQDKSLTDNKRYLQPLIKISEMYLIAAESAPTAAEGIPYLNTLRFNRNLVALALTANRTTEIEKEYKKEFYGEGQLFFFYKRTNAATVLKGESTSTAAAGKFTMDSSTYVVPIPDSETIF